MFEGVVGRHDLDAFAATFQVAQAYLVEGVHRVRVYSPDREVPTHFSDIDAPVRAVANSVYALSPTFAMSGFFVYPFFAALMAGLSVMRDDEAGLSELLQSTPLTRAEVCLGEVRGRLMRDDDRHARTSPTSAFRFAPDDDSTASDGRSSSLGETVGTS